MCACRTKLFWSSGPACHIDMLCVMCVCIRKRPVVWLMLAHWEPQYACCCLCSITIQAYYVWTRPKYPLTQTHIQCARFALFADQSVHATQNRLIGQCDTKYPCQISCLRRCTRGLDMYNMKLYAIFAKHFMRQPGNSNGTFSTLWRCLHRPVSVRCKLIANAAQKLWCKNQWKNT